MFFLQNLSETEEEINSLKEQIKSLSSESQVLKEKLSAIESIVSVCDL